MIDITVEWAWMVLQCARIVKEINDVIEDHALAELCQNEEGVPYIVWAYVPKAA